MRNTVSPVNVPLSVFGCLWMRPFPRRKKRPHCIHFRQSNWLTEKGGLGWYEWVVIQPSSGPGSRVASPVLAVSALRGVLLLCADRPSTDWVSTSGRAHSAASWSRSNTTTGIPQAGTSASVVFRQTHCTRIVATLTPMRLPRPWCRSLVQRSSRSARHGPQFPM